MSMKMEQWIFVAEINVAVDDIGTLQTHYACSGEGFATRPGDTPANTPIPPTLLDPGSLRREMFSGDRPFGAVRPAFGEVSMYNGDGRYDAWEHHGFDGRDFVLRWGPLGGAYPADFVTVFVCTVEGITLTETEARLRLRDQSQLLDKSLLNEFFLGGSVAEGGSSMMGQAKLRCVGNPESFTYPPTLLADGWGNTLYHVTTGARNISMVFDNGNELSPGGYLADFWNLAAPTAPGYYYMRSDSGSTYLRLGSRPVGDLRLIVSGGTDTQESLLAEAGYTGAIIGTPLPQLRAAVADAGITYGRLFDDAAAYAGMWYGFDRLGRFVAKAFDEPSGAPALELHRGNCVSVKRSPVAGMEVPLYQITANTIQTWKSNYTAPYNWARNRFDAEQWLYKLSYADDTLLRKHPGARSVHMDMITGPVSGAPWTTFVDRWMRMFGRDRSCITAVVPLSPDMLDIDLGDCVRVQWPRFNLAAGRLFRVIALRYSLRQRQIEIVLWG